MRRRSAPLTFAFTLAGWTLSNGCQGDRAPEPSDSRGPVVVDAAGVEHAFTQPARRIVSLVPSATRTLRAIGADDVLVGRTDFDSYDWVTDRPSVGGGLEPNLEAIVALRPDLVIRFAGEQDPRTAGRLDELGIPHLAVRPDDVEDIYEMTTIIGQATGHASAADSLVESIRAGLAELARTVADWPRYRVAYVLGGSPPWVAGPGTYIDEVISLVGGENAFGDIDALYSGVSPEEFRTRDIDVVLISAVGDFDESLAPGARVEVIGGALDVPGPGIVDAAREVARKLHGRRLQ